MTNSAGRSTHGTPHDRSRTGPSLGRVLLVDDNPSIRTMAALFLRSLGWQAVEAVNGEGAVLEALGTDFDLILMDLNLPGLDGPEATRRIRAATPETASRVPIVGMTAADHDTRRQACLDVGMDDVIDKVNLLTSLPSLLRRFARETAAAQPTPPSLIQPSAENRMTADAALDLTELTSRLALIGGEQMTRLFAKVASEGSQYLAELELAWQERRCRDAAAAAHRLAGGTATFQMMGVHTLLVRLEDALRQTTPDGNEVSGLLERLLRAWPLSVAAFERLLSAEP